MLHKITKDIWVVSPPVKPSYPYANCLYIKGNDPILIDTGAGSIALADIKPLEVSRVLLTHCHIDHTHSTILFPQADIMLGWQEEPFYYDEPVFLQHNSFKAWSDVLRLAKMVGFTDSTPPFRDVPIMDEFKHQPLAGTFNDLDSWECGSLKVTAVHLPGHTVGHYGFYIEKEGILMSGDIDLVKLGPWLGSNTADIDDFIESVQKIKMIDPKIIVPSHRRVQDQDLKRQLDTFIGVVLKRQERFVEILKVPHSLEQMMAYCLLFPEPRSDYEVYWERTTLRHHLDFSIRHKLVAEVAPGIYQRV